LVAHQNEDGGWGSGVWGRIQNSEFRIQTEAIAEQKRGSRVESLGESVLSTAYSVLNTPKPLAADMSNPKSRIQNLKSSVEETALAVEALLAVYRLNPEPRDHRSAAVPVNLTGAAVERGLAWLIERVENNQHRQPAPIGFYFAKLWYYEKLYPLAFTVSALGRAARTLADTSPTRQRG
jgi:hypothetical protein